MVRDVGLAYREIDGGRDREIFCPVCHEYGRGVAAKTMFCSNQRLKYLKKAIARHMATYAHSKALTKKERESRVGLTIARTTLQTVREGNSYLKFEEKLHSFHLACVDIGSLNHSREFAMAFVGSMSVVMDLRIQRHHLHDVDAVT